MADGVERAKRPGRIRTFVSGVRDQVIRPSDVEFVDGLRARGIQDVATVPCSITKGMDGYWQQLAADGKINYWPMVNEHSLVGVTSGVFLATGRLALAHMQNSGLTNAGDGFISWARVYRVPTLALVTWRGNDLKDDSEPHQEIGNKTLELTKAITDEKSVFGKRGGRGIFRKLDHAIGWANRGNQSILRLSPDAFTETYELKPPEDIEYDLPILEEREEEIRATKGSPRHLVFSKERVSRIEAMQDIVRRYPDAAIIFSNGYNARAAQAYVDRVGNLYNAGYMGGCLAIGWGMAVSNPNIKVVVVDGDQNAQMGKMTEILDNHYPDNLFWEVLDNGYGTSVGVARSNRLPHWYYNLARVIRTIPDEPKGPKKFNEPRVGARGAYFSSLDARALAREIGSLPAHMNRFRNWVDSQTGQK